MEQIPETPDTKTPKEKDDKRKMPRWLKWVLIGVPCLIAAAVIAVLIMGGSLLSRMAEPGTTTFAEEEPEIPEETPTPMPIPALTPTPAPEPGATPAPTPTPEPTPEPPLPLSDLYPQTKLTDFMKGYMEELNQDTENYTNVLLIGVDRRGSRGDSQADVMMIATLDKKNGRLKLMSILRDVFVHIPGHGEYRLNSAAAKGGVPLLMDTINENFHLNISQYVLVDFNMFEKVVNKLGGVTVRMTAEEISAANDCIAGLNKQRGVDYLWDGFIFAEAGNVRLTGKQALGYSRVRKIDSDFTRTNRQFKVLSAIFAKFRSKNLLEQYDILNEIMPMVETNMNAGDIIECATAALKMDTPGILSYTVPIEGLYKSGRVNGSSVLLLDLPMHAWRMHHFIYNNHDIPDEAKVLSAGASLPPRTPSPTLEPQYVMLPDGTVVAVYPTPDPGMIPGGETVPTPVPEIPEAPEIEIPEIPEVEIPEIPEIPEMPME